MVGLVSVAYRQNPAVKAPLGTAPDTAEGVQTAQHVNSGATASATLSNTAPSYATLGGRFRFNNLASAETDYALFGYQVPATHRLIVTGVAIGTGVTVAIGTAGAMMEWGIAVDSTAASLATADSTPVFGPRRLPLGVQGFAASAAAGAVAIDLDRRFNSPLIVKPSRYFHVILRVIIGEATGTFRGAVMVDGFFEAIA